MVFLYIAQAFRTSHQKGFFYPFCMAYNIVYWPFEYTFYMIFCETF